MREISFKNANKQNINGYVSRLFHYCEALNSYNHYIKFIIELDDLNPNKGIFGYYSVVTSRITDYLSKKDIKQGTSRGEIYKTCTLLTMAHRVSRLHSLEVLTLPKNHEGLFLNCLQEGGPLQLPDDNVVGFFELLSCQPVDFSASDWTEQKNLMKQMIGLIQQVGK